MSIVPAQSAALAVSDESLNSILEQVVVQNDLSKLNAPQRLEYYNRLCESLDLNPLTRPFQYMTLNNKLTLYATRDAAEQLRHRRKVSIQVISREIIDGILVVTVRATDPQGRTDESTGALVVAGLKGEALANAYMKAETKAKRRVTLSFCGLGVLDETEIETAGGFAIQLNEDGTLPESLASSAPVQASNPAAEALARAAQQAKPEVIEGQVVEEPSSDQRAMFFALHTEIGLPPHSDAIDKQVNYRVWGKLIGRDVTSWTQLSKAEVSQIVDWMNAVKEGLAKIPPIQKYRDQLTGQATLDAPVEPRGMIDGFSDLVKRLKLTEGQVDKLLKLKGERDADKIACCGWIRGLETFEQFETLFADAFDDLEEMNGGAA